MSEGRLGRAVSEERQAELVEQAKAIVARNPWLVERAGEDAAIAHVYSTQLDHERCGHLASYRDFIRCIYEDEDE